MDNVDIDLEAQSTGRSRADLDPAVVTLMSIEAKIDRLPSKAFYAVWLGGFPVVLALILLFRNWIMAQFGI